METIGLYVLVPVASFRVPRAREYFETFPVPPPATVYGMLLSMVGEINRRVYEGVDLAVALLSDPEYSVVLRTLWRVKSKNQGLGIGENRRPDFQELLTNVQFAIWIRDNTNRKSFTERILNGFNTPSTIDRFGSLCLGESTHLVDEVKLMKDFPNRTMEVLLNDDEGDLSLPIWADHVGPNSTWGQFKLKEANYAGIDSIPNAAWTTIARK